MTSVLIRVVLSSVGLMVVLGGCDAPPALTQPPAEPPGSFGVAVDVLPGAGRTPDGSIEPARYILEPDGSLRAATGVVQAGEFPRLVRRLDADARARVYRLTLATGAHDPAPDRRVPAPDLFRPETPTTLVTVGWGEGRSAASFDPDDPDARALADELARLAWVKP
ncbi:MAG: hypothetical protein RIB60_06520 [Phycisphaerales bacterium]